MKKIIISILIILALSGCWDYKELNNYSIVTGVAIDKSDDKYEVSVLISNSPKNGSDAESSKAKIVVYSGTGDTIFAAFKDIGLISPKELYLGHFSVLIISEDIAREGIKPVIDIFLRESTSKKNFYVTITRDCKAKDTLKIITPLSDFPSQNITDNLLSTTELQGLVSNINFNELLSNLERSGIEPVMNSIKIIGDEKKGSSNKNVETSEPKSYIKLDTIGIFKGDKLIDFTSKTESVGINVINNKIAEMYVKVKYNNGYVVINTTKFSSDVKVSLENNKPVIKINAKGEAKIVEVNCDIDLNSDKELSELNKKLNKEVKRYIKKGLSVAQENESDIFGFGLKLYQDHPKYYNSIKDNWNEELKNINVEIKTDIVLKSKGSSQKSLEENHE